MEIQDRIRQILDEHFHPLLKDEWKSNLSIYDIGARGQNCLDEVVVWMRSSSLEDHVSGLMLPSPALMVMDPVDRASAGDGRPRLRDSTVLVRLLKPVDTESDGSVDLLIEMFQVFPDSDQAESCYDSLVASTSRTVARS